jgi:hypothetical protein
MCIPPVVASQQLCKHVPAARNTRNNRRIVGPVCLWVCLCIPLSLGKSAVKTFLRQRRIFGGIVFYALRVVSKESRRLVLPRTYCLKLSLTFSITNTIVLDVTPYSLVENHRRFRETYCLHIQGWRASQANNQQAAASKQSLLFDSEYGGSIFLRNVGELLPAHKASHPETDSALNIHQREVLRSAVQAYLIQQQQRQY